MGWWNASKTGASLLLEDTGLAWGDGPADILDNALEEIITRFKTEKYGPQRPPTRDELIAGLLFAINPLKDDDLSQYDDEDAKESRAKGENCPFCGQPIPKQ